ncbi:hypothetical protein TNCV_1708241 [Trichonephila clavipes]|nr:hypothetical protein TNCV_1708241 [Trichonephila clavipes]
MTAQFDLVILLHPNFEGEHSGTSSPSTILSRRLAAQRMFREPQCRTGSSFTNIPCLLQDLNPSATEQ